MEYIFNKIILVTKYEKYKHISNLGLGEFWGDFVFVVNVIDIHLLNLKPFRNLRLLVGNPFNFFFGVLVE
jgi:hypothetical protein